MSIKAVTTLIAGCAAVAAAVGSLTLAPASADTATCVDAWNSRANSAAQQDLSEFFADDGAGNVIVGSKDGDCILAAHNILKPTYVVYAQGDDDFELADGGPGDEFWQYVATVTPVNVILTESGKVESVSA
ncbi:MAG: hypothetical protein QOH57_2924 [Mycobacterium sp.]|jgi:hypothetical protein|nr:hypothetical protein [Mycobacterium sp.]